MKPVRIPLELIFLIIDNLWNDPFSLKSCSLVCSSWTSAAHSYLFRTLVLGKEWSELRPLCVFSQDIDPIQTLRTLGVPSVATQIYRDFLNLLTHAPGIVAKIHFLALAFRSRHSDPSLYQQEEVEVLSKILLQLTRVATIHLGIHNWDAYPIELRDAVTTVIRQPSISKLTIRSYAYSTVSNLITLCRQSPGLKVLDIIYSLSYSGTLDQDVPDIDVVDPVETVAHLEDLRISACSSSFIEWMLRPRCFLDIGSLRRLNLELDTVSGSIVRSERAIQLIRKTAPRLEDLELDGEIFMSISIRERFYKLDLSPNLRCLRLRGVQSSSTYSSAYILADMFSRLTISLPLEELYMVIEIQCNGFFSDGSDAPLIWPAWREVDTQLVRSELGQLRTITITLLIHAGLEDSERNMLDVFPAFRAQPGATLEISTKVL